MGGGVGGGLFQLRGLNGNIDLWCVNWLRYSIVTMK